MPTTVNENGMKFVLEQVKDETLSELLLPHILPWYENQTRCENPKILSIRRIKNSKKFLYKVNVEYRRDFQIAKTYDCTVHVNGEVSA